MTKARDSSVVALDFETTGTVAGYPNEPWQLGLVRVNAGEVVSSSRWETLFHVGDRPFSPRAVGRYAGMRAELAAAPSPIALWPDLAARLVGAPLAAHNAATERTVLTRLAPLTRFGPWIDTLRLARLAYPGLASYALGDLVAALGLVPAVNALCPGRTWHDALYDACAGGVLFAHFVNLPAWRDVALEELSC